MTRRDDRVPIRHALDAARTALSSTSGWNRSDLDLTQLATQGLLRLLEVIGEAASSVSAETKRAHPHIPWRQMSGLRNRLIHAYFNVNLDIVWDTLRQDLPGLIPTLEALLSDLEASR